MYFAQRLPQVGVALFGIVVLNNPSPIKFGFSFQNKKFCAGYIRCKLGK